MLITKELKKLIEYKTIYLAPYKDEVLEFQKKIKKFVPSCNIIGFIDSFKKGNNIYTINSIDTSKVDLILIYSYFSMERIIKFFITENNKIEPKLVRIAISNKGKYRVKNNLKETKQVVCFGNCQAGQISYFLNTYAYSIFSAVHYRNYDKNISDEAILEAIKKADILIYQPLSDNHHLLSHTNIKQITDKLNIISITFPYIYNNGIYSLESDGFKTLIGKEIITQLYINGLKRKEIISLYEEDKIDFDLVNRFNKSLLMMKKKEKDLDIKLVKYIKRNYKKKKLFIGYNHPSNDIFYEIIRQIKLILKIDFTINKNIKLNPLSATVSPVSQYDINTHGYKFNADYSNEWFYKGSAIINLIISEYCLKRRKIDE